MLEGGGDVLAAEAGDILTHVSAKNLVERCGLLARCVEGLELSPF